MKNKRVNTKYPRRLMLVRLIIAKNYQKHLLMDDNVNTLIFQLFARSVTIREMKEDR
jgi:hypothetical protein